MALWTDLLLVVTLLTALTVGLLGYVWLRNYRRFRSRVTLGLTAVAALFVLENLVTAYLFALHPVLAPWIVSTAPIAQQALTGLKVLELLALLTLTYLSWE